eukprot:14958152-Alexandrium_andersonii.AAC.1
MGWVGDISAAGPEAQRWRRPAGGTVATGCSTTLSTAAPPSRCSSAAAVAECAADTTCTRCRPSSSSS